ncbi:hypothetical protein ACVILJ_000704 [Bradyrhizobium diazoefficiens]
MSQRDHDRRDTAQSVKRNERSFREQGRFGARCRGRQV